MSRTIKRMTAILLSVMMITSILTALPFTANAATSGTTGSCTWKLDDNGTLTVSGNGLMHDYSAVAGDNAPWIDKTKQVVFERGVDSVGNEAFYKCALLEQVTLSNTIGNIGRRAFSYCTKLKQIIIPESVTRIHYESFDRCSNLETIVIPDSVEFIGNNAFRGCGKLTVYCNTNSAAYYYAKDNRITTAPIEDAPMPDISQSGTTGDCTWALDNNGTLTIKGSGMMENYNYEEPYVPWDIYAVKRVIIEDGVKNIGNYAFYNCKKLTEVTIPDSVTSIGYCAFEYCEKLTSVVIPGSVTSIGYDAFSSCKSLASVVIPDSVTKLGNSAFSYCSNLTSVIIGDGLNCIGEYAFFRCEKLSSFTIGKNVTSIEWHALQSGESLKSITIPASVTFIDQNSLGYYLKSGMTLKVADFTIYGYNGTTAQQYANDNGFAFVSLGDIPVEPTTVEPTTAEPTTVEPTTEPAPAVMVGDVNGDNVVNGADAGLLSRYTSGWKGYESKIKNMAAADINGDGNVNGADSGILARYTSGWKQYDKYFQS